MQPAANKPFSLRYEPVAHLQGKDVYRIRLQNSEVAVELTNLGCTLLSVETPDRRGRCENVVAAFPNVNDYLVNKDYLGCVVGRYANRIANGRFSLNGVPYRLPLNDGPNHLHGGTKGFHQQIWEVQGFIVETERTGVRFRYLSRDGEEGYPGNLDVMVSYSLTKKNELCIEYGAETDRPTPVNLTNHAYFNLSGFAVPVINHHRLQVNAAFYTEKNERNVPTGALLPVAGTALDFKQPREIGIGIDRFPQDGGYDHNFVLAGGSPGEVAVAAELYEPVSGRLLRVSTSQPGLQVYTANYWDSTVNGVQGCLYQKHGAVALETQAFPDSPNQPSFPNTILNPGETYASTTVYAFSVVEQG